MSPGTPLPSPTLRHLKLWGDIPLRRADGYRVTTSVSKSNSDR